MRLTTRDLKVGYEDNIIVSNLNIKADKGEIVCLMGPNGSGKSTIIKTISRHINKLGGSISLIGKSLYSLNSKELAKNLSVVLTDRINPQLMTGKEIIATARYPYTGYLGSLDKIDKQAIHKSIDMVGASSIANKYYSQLSDGQRQRILLARAIAQDTDVIVLDEPTSFLDLRYKIDLLNVLIKLAKDYGKTVILSMHEIELISKIADKVVLLEEDGYRYGSPEEILTSENINKVFKIEPGLYNPLLGSTELTKLKGAPEVFVLAGQGTGTPIYRMLAKNRIPFITGVLFDGDIDNIVANQLSTKVITADSNKPIPKDILSSSIKYIKEVKYFLDTGANIEGIGEGNVTLLKTALSQNKAYSLIDRSNIQTIGINDFINKVLTK